MKKYKVLVPIDGKGAKRYEINEDEVVADEFLFIMTKYMPV